MSSILEALKKVETETEEKEVRPFEWPQPLDARQSLARRLKNRHQFRFFSYKSALLFFFSTTLILLAVLYISKQEIQKNPLSKSVIPVTIEKETLPEPRKIVVEKTDKGVNAFIVVEPKTKHEPGTSGADATEEAAPEINSVADARETLSEAAEEEDVFQEETVIPSKKADRNWLILHGISWSAEPSKRMAVINATIAREGRVVDGARVVRIDKKHVIIEKDGEQLLLTFDKY